MKKRISIITLGCPKNQVDSEYLATSIENDDFEVIHEYHNSDIVIINTCGFIQDAKEQSIDTILDLVKEKQKGNIEKIVVFGCLSERYKKELIEEIPEVDAWFGVNSISQIVGYLTGVEHMVEFRRKKYLTTLPHYAYLKISDGCNRTCSFCVIPMIKGKYVSLPIEMIIHEAQRLTSEGVKELIIVSQDTTYYGLDLYGKRKLTELLSLLATETDAKWIRIHYAYPTNFPLELLEVMQKHDKICKYIDIPFQHVNDVILNNMRRNHTKADIENLITLMRNMVPEIFIRSAFIVGFPGEGKKEFNELCEFLQKYRLERVGFFAYSDEEETPAYNLKNKLKQKTIFNRMHKLYSITEKYSKQVNSYFMNKIIEVIVDQQASDYAEGRTQYDSPEIDNTVIIHNTKGQFAPGMITKVKIVGFTSHELISEPVS